GGGHHRRLHRREPGERERLAGGEAGQRPGAVPPAEPAERRERDDLREGQPAVVRLDQLDRVRQPGDDVDHAADADGDEAPQRHAAEPLRHDRQLVAAQRRVGGDDGEPADPGGDGGDVQRHPGGGDGVVGGGRRVAGERRRQQRDPGHREQPERGGGRGGGAGQQRHDHRQQHHDHEGGALRQRADVAAQLTAGDDVLDRLAEDVRDGEHEGGRRGGGPSGGELGGGGDVSGGVLRQPGRGVPGVPPAPAALDRQQRGGGQQRADGEGGQQVHRRPGRGQPPRGEGARVAEAGNDLRGAGAAEHQPGHQGGGRRGRRGRGGPPDAQRAPI